MKGRTLFKGQAQPYVAWHKSQLHDLDVGPVCRTLWAVSREHRAYCDHRGCLAVIVAAMGGYRARCAPIPATGGQSISLLSLQIIAAQEEMLRKERELEEARKKLAMIRQQQYKFLPTELRDEEQN